MFWKREKNVTESIKQIEQLDKEYLSMKEVMDFLPFSRSYLYELKDKGVLESVQEGTLRQPSYKYTTRSVLKILLGIENHETAEETKKLELEKRKTRNRNISKLRKRLYGT